MLYIDTTSSVKRWMTHAYIISVYIVSTLLGSTCFGWMIYTLSYIISRVVALVWFSAALSFHCVLHSLCSRTDKFIHVTVKVPTLLFPSGHHLHDWGGVSGASRQVHQCGVHASGLGISSVCEEVYWRVQAKGPAPSSPHQQCRNIIQSLWLAHLATLVIPSGALPAALHPLNIA